VAGWDTIRERIRERERIRDRRKREKRGKEENWYAMGTMGRGYTPHKVVQGGGWKWFSESNGDDGKLSEHGQNVNFADSGGKHGLWSHYGRKSTLLEGAPLQSFAKIPFGSVARPAGFDVRRYQGTEAHHTALGSSRNLDANCLRLFEMRTKKKGSIVSSSTTDEGLAGSGGTRLVGGRQGGPEGAIAGECRREQWSSVPENLGF
jgi:hypothetical protein